MTRHETQKMSLLHFCHHPDTESALALLRDNGGQDCDIYEVDNENKGRVNNLQNELNS